MTNGTEGDYGQKAVEQPAEHALAYGDDAVAQGVKVAQAKARPSTSTGGKKQQRTKNDVTVNPASRITAFEFGQLLRTGALPKAIRSGVRVKSKSNMISFPDAVPKSLSDAAPWMKDLLSISRDWELTTGTLKIIFDQSYRYKGSRVVPDLQRPGDTVDLTAGRDSDEIGLLSYDSSGAPMVIPKSSPHTQDFKNLHVLGLTMPKPALTPKGSTDESALLISSRGLVVLAREVAVTLLRGGTSEQFIEPKINVSKLTMGSILVHELGAHAGLLSQDRPAAHNSNQSSPVEQNTSDIEAVFDKSTRKPTKQLLVAVLNQIGQVDTLRAGAQNP